MNKKQSEMSTTTPMLPLVRFSVVLAMVSQVSGFQSVRGFQASRQGNSARTTRTGGYGSDIFVQPAARSSGFSTTLLYRSSADESTTSSPLKWFNTILPRLQDKEDNEQESVDEYLEFLDRRYRRLHSAEQKEESKHFSALNWLTQGSDTRNQVMISQQQHEDALYVLGVAGLASEKLLQKHHLPMEDENLSSAKAKQTHHAIMEVMDADIVHAGPAALLIKKVIVPIIRVVYMAQRRKELFVASQLQKIKVFTNAALRKIMKSALSGPATAAQTLFEVGGGKKTLALTAAFAATAIFVLRPILQAALTEGAV